ncbi:B12-binding domain-containing radical SAM protein [Bythopirellula polymerisocia]|uniref:Biotin synthase n=1 Tax=Bythopirellula polymerisocia TaxID=2528003 RepID=A0A5C6CJ28_9BACT|nr:cobalamin-dependent protein [Bythopirellula polymerisocia]TWU24590.1 biotin synthase [Bythopirellula polymerisocia]
MSKPTSNHPLHPRGTNARVLLTSVFGPYAQDDAYGSRLINPMELYHNQVTRVQQGFSLRTFNRSWGLMLIQVNLQAPCTLLDFPTEARFVEELKTNQYDIIGISSIMTNLLKVRRMCKLIRKHQPTATIVVGGHIANLSVLPKYADVDHIVRGDGVRWMRKFLGEDEHQPIRHPVVRANIGSRIMGVILRNHPGDDCATLIPSVGCPIGCNFCSTSAMFGGKGKFIEYYQTGDELYEIMSELESSLCVKSFFVMDENFLLDQNRALGLLERIEKHGKPWSLYVFSSANVLQKYTMEQLVALGVSWVWLGLEGKGSQYTKLSGTDTVQFVKVLRDHGIRVLGSSIIGLEDHTPENIDEAIEHAVSHNTEFHQFMLYTPIPGTPLFSEHEANESLKSLGDVSIADIHGQHIFNYHHPHIKDGQETEFLLRAFRRDFEVNGPSVVRIVRTVLRGWLKYKNHPDPRIRARFAHEATNLPVRYAGVLWATRRQYRDNPQYVAQINELLEDLYGEFGWRSRLAAPIAGRYLYHKLQEQQKLLEAGWTYEPPTFYETNYPAGPPDSKQIQSVLACSKGRSISAVQVIKAEPEPKQESPTLVASPSKYTDEKVIHAP